MRVIDRRRWIRVEVEWDGMRGMDKRRWIRVEWSEGG